MSEPLMDRFPPTLYESDYDPDLESERFDQRVKERAENPRDEETKEKGEG